mmetsp:Transcript_3352/g.15497  ORF Transcript_3352/g.15497 Transcript_3352/m.15497 type:complete len:385 (-) Transcript_3352:353-1507(-)
MASLSCSQRSSMVAFSPAPSRMMVSSLLTVIFLAVPSMEMSTWSSLWPRSSETTVPPVRMAMSWRLDLRFSPKPGALTAQIFTPPLSLLTMRVARASDSTSSATMRSGRLVLSTDSSTGRSGLRPEIFFSKIRTYGFSSSHFWFLALVMKYGEMYPRSNFIPSTTSSSFSSVLPSATVMTPSLPTFSMARAMRSPISRSPLAEMVPTCAISSVVEMSLALLLSSATTLSTAAWIPRRRSMGFMPAATDLHPSLKMALVSTVAVVVPSPATSLVADATCFTRLAPRFMNLSENSMFLATVTPSFVILGAPKLCSMTTLRPLGPMVTCTASASWSQPWSIMALDSTPNLTSLARPRVHCLLNTASICVKGVRCEEEWWSVLIVMVS